MSITRAQMKRADVLRVRANRLMIDLDALRKQVLANGADSPAVFKLVEAEQLVSIAWTRLDEVQANTADEAIVG